MAGEWNRLTRHAKRAVRESQDLAASLGGASVLSEHLLMTILDDPGSAGALLLSLAGVSADELRSVLEESIAGESLGGQVEKPAFSPALRETVERAGLMVADGLIGTDHLVVAALWAGGPLKEAVQTTCRLDDAELWAQLELLGSHELAARAAPARSSAASPAGTRSGESLERGAAALNDLERSARPAPQPEMAATAGAPAGVPIGRTFQAESPETSVHTVLALARIIVDLSGKAARAAADSGNSQLAQQLEKMRAEAEIQLRAARPGGGLGGRTGLLDEGTA